MSHFEQVQNNNSSVDFSSLQSGPCCEYFQHFNYAQNVRDATNAVAWKEDVNIVDKSLSMVSHQSTKSSRNVSRRKRIDFNSVQKAILNDFYEHRSKYATPKMRSELVSLLNVDDKRVMVWFKNRRQYEKKGRKLNKNIGKPPYSPALTSSTSSSPSPVFWQSYSPEPFGEPFQHNAMNTYQQPVPQLMYNNYYSKPIEYSSDQQTLPNSYHPHNMVGDLSSFNGPHLDLWNQMPSEQSKDTNYNHSIHSDIFSQDFNVSVDCFKDMKAVNSTSEINLSPYLKDFNPDDDDFAVFLNL